jgi:hypothetical protein
MKDTLNPLVYSAKLIVAGMIGSYIGLVLTFGFLYRGGGGLQYGLEIAMAFGLIFHSVGGVLGLGAGLIIKNKWAAFVPGLLLGLAMLFMGWQ